MPKTITMPNNELTEEILYETMLDAWNDALLISKECERHDTYFGLRRQILLDLAILGVHLGMMPLPEYRYKSSETKDKVDMVFMHVNNFLQPLYAFEVGFDVNKKSKRVLNRLPVEVWKYIIILECQDVKVVCLNK